MRVGVARSDPRGVLAVPVATLRRDRRARHRRRALLALGAEYEAVGYVIGLPRTLAGREGASVAMAREFGEALAERLRGAPSVPAPAPGADVHYLDERLTTVSAQRKLAASGIRGPAGRAVIDQAAAVELLQHWLDMHRT